MHFKLAVMLLGVSCASCSSITFSEDIAQTAALASAANLQRHLESITAFGPRPASNVIVQGLTLQYLEQELQTLGISTERETFELTPSSKLVLSLETASGKSERLEIPGVHFGKNISQARVVHGQAAAWGVLDRLDGYGIEFGHAEAIDQFNLLATIPGTLAPERVLELSAHYDTVPGTVGADDNTSGVVALLEVARLLQINPPACTIRLCFFAAEEIGLLGSKEHVRLMQENASLDRLVGLINLDAVGHFTGEPNSQTSPTRIPLVVWPPSTGDFLTIIGANGSAELGHLIEDAGDLYVPDLRTYSLARIGGSFPDARRSDHAHYWDRNIPAIFLTDTGEFRSDNYHRPSDDLENVDVEALRKVTALAYASAASAANQAAREAR